MNEQSTPPVLPPVRKTVFKNSLFLVAVYVGVGSLMMIAVFLASNTTPKAIHVNYDSISATNEMKDAWSELSRPELFPGVSSDTARKNFETALRFEETNITEVGEAETAARVRKAWSEIPATRKPTDAEFHAVWSDLNLIIDLNEKGMFSWAERSHRFSREVFFGTVVIFLITIFLALYLADSLAVKIASPLRELSAVLKQRPEPGGKLKLPAPQTLEVGILTQALVQFWERITYFQTLNLDEIAAQRKKLEAVLVSIEDAVLVLDSEGKIIHYNPGFLATLPGVSEPLFGVLWRDLPTASSNYMNLRAYLIPEVSHDQNIELEIKGKKRVFAARHRQISDEKKTPIGHLYLLHDITENKQRDLLRAEFIGVLSHELKTPLQSLGTASELLVGQAHEFPEDEKMLIETIAEDTKRIKNVVNEFVEVGVSELHSLRLKIEPTPIQKLIVQWMQPVQVLARERSVRVTTGQTVSEKVLVRIDSIKFSWAVGNLLSNALRVSPPESEIQVSVFEIQNEVVIEIVDGGPGITSDVQQRMFEPYFQADPKEGPKTSGFLGLGLTITREVVEAHQGAIQYTALTPKGSRFRIRLPRVLDSSEVRS